MKGLYSTVGQEQEGPPSVAALARECTHNLTRRLITRPFSLLLTLTHSHTLSHTLTHSHTLSHTLTLSGASGRPPSGSGALAGGRTRPSSGPHDGPRGSRCLEIGGLRDQICPEVDCVRQVDFCRSERETAERLPAGAFRMTISRWPTRWTARMSLLPKFEGHMTELAPQKALKLIT